MNKLDIICSLLGLSIGLALIFWIIPVYIPETYAGSYGLYAQSFPRFVAVFITALSALLLVSSLRQKVQEERAADAPLTVIARHMLISTVIFVAGAIIMATMNFLAGGTAMVLALMLLMGERRLLPLLATSAASPLFIWAFVWQVLGYRLP